MCGARGSNEGVVEYLAETVESLNGEAIDCTGATALHHAAIAGHPTVITALSNIPQIVLDATDKVSREIFILFIIYHTYMLYNMENPMKSVCSIYSINIQLIRFI